MTIDMGSNTSAELVAADVGRHTTNVLADKLHGITAIAHPRTMTAASFGGAAVNDGNEVICDDEAVLVFPFWVLRYAALFDNFHSLLADCRYRVVLRGRCALVA